MNPARLICLSLCGAICLGTSSCEAPLTIQEQNRLAQVLPWSNGTYAPDPRQGLVYVDPMSPYRGGLRPVSGYHWLSPDPNDFRTTPYRGGPYLINPKYPLLAAPWTSASWQGRGTAPLPPQNTSYPQAPDDSAQQPSRPVNQRPQSMPPASGPGLESSPSEPRPAPVTPSPYRSVDAPRDKPV